MEFESPRLPRPITWEEQEALFKELPKHLTNMATFAVNSGLRDENVCGLKWQWEVKVPEVSRSFFVIPPAFHKTGKSTNRPHVVILNDAAWSVVNEQRGRHSEYMFVYRQERRRNFDQAPVMQYHRVGTMNNNAWQSSRTRVGLSNVRVHDLRHTYGTRLRAAGVSNEDHAALLGHATKTMPRHYGAADIGRLIKLFNLALERNSTRTVLSVVNG